MTDVELTILSLVAQGAQFGQDIEKYIETHHLRDWLPIGSSSVYYVLNKLENQHLITGRLQASGQSVARKGYTVTDAGHGVLQTALMELLRQPRALGTSFEVGLANLDALRPAQVHQVLSDHLHELEQRLTVLEKRAPFDDTVTPLYAHALAMMRAEQAWLTHFIDTWQQKHPKTKGDDRDNTQHIRRESPDQAQFLHPPSDDNR